MIVNKSFVITGHTRGSMGWKKSGKLVFTATIGDLVTTTFRDTDANTSYGMALDAIALKAY